MISATPPDSGAPDMPIQVTLELISKASLIGLDT